MSHHMVHKDVLERILNILKQDDYYRTLEELPVIDGLMTYDDIKLFLELYDTSTIIERITTEVDLIERQLRLPGMYPISTNHSLSTSAPKPKSVSEINTESNPSMESSPQSLLPCGQCTPTALTSSSDASSSHAPPRQHIHMQHTSPRPHRQQT